MDKSKIIKMLVLLIAITVIAGGLLRMLQRNSMSLADYEKLNGGASENVESREADHPADKAETSDEDTSGFSAQASGPDNAGTQDGNTKEPDAGGESPSGTENLQNPEVTPAPASLLTGASLNGNSQTAERITYEEGFYYEPISDNLRRYITGISYPAVPTAENAADSDGATADGTDSSGMSAAGSNTGDAPQITPEELRYVHILHYDFDGNPVEGELICNEYIAQDLVEIFYQLYCNEYRLERVLLIDEYDGDDVASMEDNNTSCFNYRVVAGSSSLSKHAYGLAIDINPLYNPYITYGKDGTANVSPASGADYADRSLSFPYKIDEDDLCYQLFIRHGFTWGGSWNHSKDYQHFQKAKP
ncbi:MAG: M15 family metallopeptidase [Butyrivibrio sp.]|nr:M15 family metallopeptidase [Acetatifactor muris]MCM1558657.1 M15 family metallopeptidase [Butyrivibrio sp.]